MHEDGVTVHPNYLPKEPSEAAKAKLQRTRNAWNFVFPGSPLAEALGCRVDVCRAVGSVEIFAELDKRDLQEASEASKVLASTENLRELLSVLSEQHVAKAGFDLLECKECSLRAKMALSELLGRPEERRAVEAVVRKLNGPDKLGRDPLIQRLRFVENKPREDSFGVMSPVVLTSEETLALAKQLGRKLEFEVDEWESKRAGYLKRKLKVLSSKDKTYVPDREEAPPWEPDR